MERPQSKFATFQRCITALRSGDFSTAENLLNNLRLLDSEPRALALAREIRDRALQRRSSAVAGGSAGALDVAAQDAPTEIEPEPSFSLEPGELLLSDIDKAPASPGISLVAGCMNREANLLKVIGSWLATSVDEIVIVDWSSASELWPKLSAFDDPRIKVVRIDGERRWIASHALNVGLRFASSELVFRVDSDIELSPDFFKENLPQAGEFVRGFWKAGLEHGGESQQYIHGTFGAHKRDLRGANYYDERILTYGWEDSELYLRLMHQFGLAARVIHPRYLRHIEQSEEARIAHQDVASNLFLGSFKPTVLEGEKNKHYTAIEGSWSSRSPAQDYRLRPEHQRLYRGRRVTRFPHRNQESAELAETLAIRQLVIEASPSLSQFGAAGDISLDVARLIQDARRVNRSQELLDGINSQRGLQFVRCEDGPCRNALRVTLQSLAKHYPAFLQSVVIAEIGNEKAAAANTSALSAHGELIDKLAQRLRATELRSFTEFVERLAAGDLGAGYLRVSVQSLAEEAIAKAEHCTKRLAHAFEPLQDPLPGTCLVTSLYDEQNLLRLLEYVACLVQNTRIFERIAISYESSNGLVSAVVQAAVERLGIQPGRLLLLPFQRRPSFEELFSVKSLLPEGSIVVVANADIFFDATLSKIRDLDLSRNVAVLSRHDISSDGRAARLIHLENGIPNTFSADVWIFKTPFQQDFRLDYRIGTFNCDSFINHQISKSSRYGVVNPCLDVRAFHLHDERFNSSAEKQKRDAEQIRKTYLQEQERNGGADPIKGVAWSTVPSALILPGSAHFQTWKPKGLFFQLTTGAELTFGHLLLMHYLFSEIFPAVNSSETVPAVKDVSLVISISREAIHGAAGRLLARYKSHFQRNEMLFDVHDSSFDVTEPLPETTVRRAISFSDLLQWADPKDQEPIYQFLAWPKTPNVHFLRCQVTGPLATEETLRLIDRMRPLGKVLESLADFIEALPEHSGEKNILLPYLVPYLRSRRPLVNRKAGARSTPAVSFVTSLFKGGEFLPGYLENVLAAATEAEGEVILIDANTDDADSRVIKSFLKQRPAAPETIQYVRLDRDPGLYACWRIAIERSRSDFISNANIDDRRCPTHAARLVQILNEHPEYAGACGTICCVRSGAEGGWFELCENELWFYGENLRGIGLKNLYAVANGGEIKSRDVMHCMPVWRKSLHRRYGFFDEAAYGTSADWAFWLKCAKAGEKFIFDEGAFGRYFLNPDSHNRRNDPEGLKERRIIKDFLGIEQRQVQKQ